MMLRVVQFLRRVQTGKRDESVSAPSRLSFDYSRRGKNRMLVGVGEWENEKQLQREWQE